MSFPRIALSLHGIREEYQLVEVPTQIDTADFGCIRCGKKLAERASLIQYGFWEDELTVFCHCSECNQLHALRQTLPFHWEVTNGQENK